MSSLFSTKKGWARLTPVLVLFLLATVRVPQAEGAGGELVIVSGSTHLTLPPGGTARFTVTVSSQQPVRVTLSLSGLPDGWRYALAPAVGNANPQFASRVTITPGSSAPADTHTITITATGDNGKTASDSLIVEVTQPAPSPSKSDPLLPDTSVPLMPALGLLLIAVLFTGFIIACLRVNRSRAPRTREERITRFCPYCGRGLLSAGKFCDTCGRLVI